MFNRLAFVLSVLFVFLIFTASVFAQPFAYVTDQSSNNVLVIDTATNMVVGSPIVVGEEPVAVAITPDSTRAYVTNISSDNVSVIDTATNMTVGPPLYRSGLSLLVWP